ncbi:hypothetical protein BDW22DRAFT_1321198 [Trametopsis cervina]|nr:hypothetical protein BDW22DRAFT_1321198 [Trametopsis cervina]
MAALALPASQSLFNVLRIPGWRQFLAAPFFPAFAAAPTPSSWTLPTSLQSLLELFPPFLLAVPKKKTSHSRKAMRSANKGLKDKHNVVHCPGCGSAKLAHHLCSNCYSSLTRGWKAKAKGGSQSEGAFGTQA